MSKMTGTWVSLCILYICYIVSSIVYDYKLYTLSLRWVSTFVIENIFELWPIAIKLNAAVTKWNCSIRQRRPKFIVLCSYLKACHILVNPSIKISIIDFLLAHLVRKMVCFHWIFLCIAVLNCKLTKLMLIYFPSF